MELSKLYFWYRKWVSTYFVRLRKYCSHSCENDSLLEFWKNGRRFPLYSSKLTLTRNVSSKEKKSCSRQQFTRILTFLSLLHFLNRCKIQHRAKYHGIYEINQPCQNPPLLISSTLRAVCLILTYLHQIYTSFAKILSVLLLTSPKLNFKCAWNWAYLVFWNTLHLELPRIYITIQHFNIKQTFFSKFSPKIIHFSVPLNVR